MVKSNVGEHVKCRDCHGQCSEPHECDDGRLVHGSECQRCGGSGREPDGQPWTCPKCSQLNSAYSRTCGRCEDL
jgi:hypothetical protein